MILRLLRLSLRYLVHHRLQCALLLLGIALGVAVVVAIDIANDSARRSLELTVESLGGAATHRIVAGPGGIEDAVYRHLRVDLGLTDCAPVLDDYVSCLTFHGRMMRLLGIDPFAEGPFRRYLAGKGGVTPVGDLTRLLTTPETVLLSADLAKRYHVRSGDFLNVQRGSRIVRLCVVGLLDAHDDLTRRALSGLLIADISTAQEVFSQPHRISSIDLVVHSRARCDQIRRELPPGLRVESVNRRASALEQLTDSFESNLQAVSLLTLVVGIFLVYNTVTFFVVQRRSLIGILRALGVTRQQIFSWIVLETLVLGVLGTTCGLLLGVLLGRAAVGLVTRTINDLYFVLTVTDTRISTQSLLKGTIVGLAASLLSALVPAWEATMVAPVGVLRRSTLEGRVQRAVPWLTLAGVGGTAAGWTLLLLPSRSMELAFGGLTLEFVGVALLVPLAVVVVMRPLAWLATRLFGIVGRIAARNVVRSLSRTAVAVAALMVAISVIIGIDVMVGSFRQTVVDWLGTVLAADVYVTTPSGTASRYDSFDVATVEALRRLPGVRSVDTARNVRMETRYGMLFVFAVTDNPSRTRRFLWTEGDVGKRLQQGAVIVSQPFAWRHPVRPGSVLELPTDHGVHSFPVVGVYYDYGTEAGIVTMLAPVYHRWWNDREVSSIALRLSHGVDPDVFAAMLRRRLGGRMAFEVMSNRGLRKSAIEVFDRTFAITSALRGLVTFVAVIGLLGTLMALQLERRREIGTLRAVGVTVRQLAAGIVLETGMLGFLAGLLALLPGWALAWALVFVVNPRSFGWTFAFLPHPWQFVSALLLATAAGVLAGVYPAWRFSRMRPAEALRVE